MRYKAIMEQSLHMDKQELVKHLQWWEITKIQKLKE